MAEVDQPTRFCFAAVVPDKVLFADQAIGTFAGLSIFVPSRFSQQEELTRWLDDHTDELRNVASPDLGRFIVAKNRSTFFIAPAGPTRALEQLNALIELMRQLPPPAPEAPDDRAPDLPEPFRDLAPLIGQWAVSDDLRRSELIETASDQALGELLGTVKPRLAEIDSALTGQDIPLLHDLAQATRESELELGRRQNQL
jgi:hypothetical protein